MISYWAGAQTDQHTLSSVVVVGVNPFWLHSKIWKARHSLVHPALAGGLCMPRSAFGQALR